MASPKFALSLTLLLCLFLCHLTSCSTGLTARQSCGQGYELCSPAGASARDVPEIGPGLARLYLNLIETVNPQPAPAHLAGRAESMTEGFSSLVQGSPATGDREMTRSDAGVGREVQAHEMTDTLGGLCCADTTQCLLVLSYNLPVCWDRFTTDYYLQDGSYGSITTGNFTTAEGDQANLITGSYQMANGQTGNIYQANQADEPNTSSLPMPTPWTSSGIGFAIPASNVGSMASSNSSRTSAFPTLTSTSVVSTVITVTSQPTSAHSIVNNTTSLVVGSTSEALSSTATSTTTAAAPVMTPPITGVAMAGVSASVWLVLLSLTIMGTYLVIH